MSKRIQLILVVILVTLSFESNATIVRWILHDVKFSDGGTASGFITFDFSVPFVLDHPNLISTFDIKTTAGTSFTTSSGVALDEPKIKIGAYEYTPANTSTVVPYYIHLFSKADNLEVRIFRFQSQPGFTATGGTVDLLTDSSGETVFDDVANSPSIERIFRRNIVSGSLIGVVVPEPASSAFVGIGLALLGLWYCRQDRRRRAFRSWLLRLNQRSAHLSVLIS